MAHRRWYVDSCSYSLRSETLSAGVLFKTCGIMLRPDADVSLPRQSLLFSEDEELGRFSGKVDQTLLPVSHNHPLAYRVLPNGFDPRPPKQCRPCAV